MVRDCQPALLELRRLLHGRLKSISEALTREDVVAEYLTDENAANSVIESDAAAISVPESTMVDLQLPTVGSSGFTTIEWTSDKPEVIAADDSYTSGRRCRGSSSYSSYHCRRDNTELYVQRNRTGSRSGRRY